MASPRCRLHCRSSAPRWHVPDCVITWSLNIVFRTWRSTHLVHKSFWQFVQKAAAVRFLPFAEQIWHWQMSVLLVSKLVSWFWHACLYQSRNCCIRKSCLKPLTPLWGSGTFSLHVGQGKCVCPPWRQCRWLCVSRHSWQKACRHGRTRGLW